MQTIERIFYFGCWDKPGHFLYRPTREMVRDDRCAQLQIPAPAQLDATVLFLPQPERVAFGARTYLPAPNCTILAWWGNPWDSRGAVNNAIILRDHATIDEIWDLFIEHFSGIAAAISRPEIVSRPTDENV